MPKVDVCFFHALVPLAAGFNVGVFAYLDVCFSFDVGRWMFDVGRSSLLEFNVQVFAYLDVHLFPALSRHLGEL